MLPPRPRAALLAVLLAMPVLPSCFTSALWGVDDHDHHHSITWHGFVERLLLTPLTLALDIATAPVQALCGGDDDDGGTCHGKGHRDDHWQHMAHLTPSRTR